MTGTDASDLDQNDFAAILRKPIDADALVNAVDTAVGGIRRAAIEPT